MKTVMKKERANKDSLDIDVQLHPPTSGGCPLIQ